MPTPKISIYQDDKLLEQALKRVRKAKIHRKTKELILEYDTENLKKGMSKRRRLKLLNHLLIASKWLKKSVDELNKKDVEAIILGLQTNTLCRKNKQPFSERTKTDYIEILKQFCSWVYPKSKFKTIFEDFRYKPKGKPPDPVIITKDQIKLLVDNTRNLQMKATIMVLFDSGARPEEFANIRFEHVKWDADRKRYLLYIEHPKEQSYKRTLDLPYCTELLSQYLEIVKRQVVCITCGTRQPEAEFCKSKTDGKYCRGQLRKLADSDTLFDYSPKYLRYVIRKMGKEILGKDIHLYTFRHSSIQHYVEVYNGNTVYLCSRYGWSYSSKMLQTYLNRSALILPDASELAHKDRLIEVEQKNEILEQKCDALQEGQQCLISQVEMIKQAVLDEKIAELGVKNIHPETKNRLINELEVMGQEDLEKLHDMLALWNQIQRGKIKWKNLQSSNDQFVNEVRNKYFEDTLKHAKDSLNEYVRNKDMKTKTVTIKVGE